MTRGLRGPVWLACRFAWAARAKLILLVSLVALGMTVFLMVTELARVSSQDLDAAIAEEIGLTGSYRLEFADDFGLSLTQLAAAVRGAVRPLLSAEPTVVEVFPPVQPECPPFASLGSLPILVLRDWAGSSEPLPFGHGLPPDTEFCIHGQVIPPNDVYLPDRAEQARWGLGVFLRAEYAHIASVAATGPKTFRFLLVTGEERDLREEILAHVRTEFAEAALRRGVEMAAVVSARRLDEGQDIRTASAGVKTVYGIIGWGVLVLGGLALLVSEILVVRDRTWFFGLARAVGAKRGHITALIVGDVTIVLLAGTLLALAVCLFAQPAVSQFAREAFNVNVRLLQPSIVPKLAIGNLLVLLMGSAYPAYKALRLDPLDVLEPKV